MYGPKHIAGRVGGNKVKLSVRTHLAPGSNSEVTRTMPIDASLTPDTLHSPLLVTGTESLLSDF